MANVNVKTYTDGEDVRGTYTSMNPTSIPNVGCTL